MIYLLKSLLFFRVLIHRNYFLFPIFLGFFNQKLFFQKDREVNSNSKSDVTEQLIQLNKLYESGALTKEEFTKAKKKLLN